MLPGKSHGLMSLVSQSIGFQKSGMTEWLTHLKCSRLKSLVSFGLLMFRDNWILKVWLSQNFVSTSVTKSFLTYLKHLKEREKLADHLFMYLTTQSVYVKIRRDLFREWKPLWQSQGWLTKIVLFLSVGYILFHIGREDKLIKRIERAFRYSKFLLSYEIYLKYTNWKLFEVRLLFSFWPNRH